MALPAEDPQRRAVLLTETHANTPTVTHLDLLGRAFLAVEHNRDSLGADVYYETRAQLDVQGNVLRITDANGTVAEVRTHGMLVQVLRTTSLEVGDRWALTDVLGAPLYATASRGFSTRHRYDTARRPTHALVTRPEGTTFTATRTVYGEAAPTPAANNLRGQVFRVYDGAGLVEHEAFDVDGNLVRQSRRLAAAYDITPDWGALDDLEDPAAMDVATAAVLEVEVFTTEASFDAMGRPVTQTTPDASVLHLGYGDAGHLETVAANVRGDVAQTSFVTDLRYNARGQRTLVVYGNGTQTSYAYDPLTFRLTQLRTERIADGHPHQDLRYTFDPVGNITEIRDLAQPVVFTSNAAVSADQRFEYDALYRLVHAEGREHGSQGQPIADDFTPRAAPEDPTGLRAYIEQYLYDAVGNILQMQHAAPGGSWTRHYSYDTTTSGNRLLATSAPGDAPGVYGHAYAHDAHGSMTVMPHLAALGWDWADRMQSADLGGGGTVHFTYDASGQRVRKVRVNQAGTSTWERIYLGGLELYRERVGTELRLERQTLHVGDDAGRVCLVETKTIDNALPIATPANISRYQYANHLGTVGFELDETGQLISYEEFHPYGTTAYRAANSAIDVSPSRYRYTGKERDEETGLGYHGARYYACWLARWTAADPIGLGDGPNRFAYVGGNPLSMSDPGGTSGKRFTAGETLTESEFQSVVEGDSSLESSTVAMKLPSSGDHLVVPIDALRSDVDAEGQDKHHQGYVFKANSMGRQWAAKYVAAHQRAVEARRTALGASRILGSNKMIVAFGIMGLAGAAGVLTGGATGVFVHGLGRAPIVVGASGGAVGGGVQGGLFAGGMALFEGASPKQALQAAGGGAVYGAGAGALLGGVFGAAAPHIQRFRYGSEGAAAVADEVAMGGYTLPKPAAPAQGGVRAGAGDAYAVAVEPGGTGRAFAGHGELRPGAGEVVIPEGTTLTLPTRQGSGILDRTGSLIEQGRWDLISQDLRLMADIEGAVTYLPGARIPNYTLKAPNGLRIRASSITVEDATPLSELLRPNAGHLDWAACLHYR